MKLTQIEAFLTVASELHFRRASERLFTTPSSVSTSIRQLEAELGIELFERTSRQVALTAAGERFRGHAQDVARSIEAARRAAAGLADGDRFNARVGIQDEGLAELTPIFIENFKARFPNASLTVEEVPYTDTEASLLNGEFDMMICTFGSSWFTTPTKVTVTPLFSEGRLVVLSARDPLAHRDQLSKSEVLSLPHLHLDNVPDSINDFYFNRAERDPAVSPDVPVSGALSMNAILLHVAQGRGVFTVTDGTRRFNSRPDIAFVRVPELAPATQEAVRRSNDRRPHIDALLEELVRTVNTSLDLIPTATNATHTP